MDACVNVSPKIVVTLSKNDITSEINEVKKYEDVIDVVEYRADLAADDVNKMVSDLKLIRETFNGKKLLFTYRTAAEGGKGINDVEVYESFYIKVITEKLCDIVDIELMIYEDYIKKLMKLAEDNGIEVLLSHHEFEFTPRIKDMMAIYSKMRDMGADYCKLAVMPTDGRDVLNLLSAVYETKQDCSNNIVGIAMGETGIISRIAGGVFGSYLTYGHVGEAVAPGQLHVEELSKQLEIYNK